MPTPYRGSRIYTFRCSEELMDQFDEVCIEIFDMERSEALRMLVAKVVAVYSDPEEEDDEEYEYVDD